MPNEQTMTKMSAHPLAAPDTESMSVPYSGLMST